MTPTTIYVVTTGCYSGYAIVGVFDDAVLAETAAVGVNGRVEEFPLNPLADRLRNGLLPWVVSLARDGTALRIYQPDHLVEERPPFLYDVFHADPPTKAMQSTVWARDEAHAIKIVNEQRAQMIAEGLWP